MAKRFFALDAKDGRLRSLANNREFVIGEFSTPSLGELRRASDAAAPPKKKPKAGLRLTWVEGDVSAFQADPANRLATFQVASQFNCLEFISEQNTPEQGITRYVFDKTQGPACTVLSWNEVETPHQNL